ncbi:MAG: triple tyrosine motif-containing protein [Bacteroidaceae bacterium]
MKQVKRSILFLLLLLSISTSIMANSWNSFIINYPKKTYGNGSQTWQIASYNNHWTYFANKNGILQFDGDKWTVLPIHNEDDIRSIYPSKTTKKIYVGGINEFGYYDANENGELTYTCLSDSTTQENATIGNVWNVHQYEHVLYFQGDQKILKYLDKKFTQIEAVEHIDCSAIINGILYVGTKKGVFVLIGNHLFPLQGADILKGKRIRGFIPEKKGILVVTSYNGLYYHNGQETTPYILGIESFLSKNEVFCTSFNKENIAIGTIHKGLVVINRKTRSAKYFNENNGLQNKTVLSLSFDENDNLWVGLDKGIDYIYLNNPLTNLYSYPNSYGTGYTAALLKDKLYLGTNRGLYYTTYPVETNHNLPTIHEMPHASGQVWNLCQIGEELFCLHDRGVYIIHNNSMQRVTNIVGAWTCQPIMNHPNKIYVGTYDGIYVLAKEKDQWKLVTKLKNLSNSSRYFQQESAQNIWINNRDNVIRVTIDSTLQEVVATKSYPIKEGSSEVKKVQISKIKDTIYFTTPKGIYCYNQKKDRIEKSTYMNHLLEDKSYYLHLYENGNQLIALTEKEITTTHFTHYKRANTTSTFSFNKFPIDLVQDAETVIPLADSLLIIPNENGFALYQENQKKMFEKSKTEVKIRNVHTTEHKDSMIYTSNFLDKKIKPILGYQLNSIQIEYGLSKFGQEYQVNYQYKLNDEDWSDFTHTEMKEYNNLDEGEYTFLVKALSIDGSISTDSFSFTILPPWYRTNLVYSIYCILFILFLWGLYKWDDLRLRQKKEQITLETEKKKEELKRKYEKENKQKEQQIIQLEKEKLEHELKHKNQEMTNLTINFFRKNEILTLIKSDITTIIGSLKSSKNEKDKALKKELLLINYKIDKNINSDDLLKRIEEQFDLLHNNFMTRINENYPDLSVKERMVCAYLKMNLCSKEIAPLLNSSIRGIETIRYRLRKKMGLTRDESLVTFIHTKL